MEVNSAPSLSTPTCLDEEIKLAVLAEAGGGWSRILGPLGTPKSATWIPANSFRVTSLGRSSEGHACDCQVLQRENETHPGHWALAAPYAFFVFLLLLFPAQICTVSPAENWPFLFSPNKTRTCLPRLSQTLLGSFGFETTLRVRRFRQQTDFSGSGLPFAVPGRL